MSNRTVSMAILILVLAGASYASEKIRIHWAYHDDADDIDDRCGETVPGERFSFLDMDSTVLGDDQPVVLYVLTDKDFAQEHEEQVLVRWWNGEQEHWIMGAWVKNIILGPGSVAGTFHGLPAQGVVTVDLWKVEIPAELTRPGENYYAIQLKGWSQDPCAIYLLRDMPEESAGRLNPLGQYCTEKPAYVGHDWSVTIQE
ncbi:MAG TPA: hypothetical protein EYP62_03315 [Kiritimatiellae bacterium]|nr:hypothetical protein [Kiritimatiellia bacterium]